MTNNESSPKPEARIDARGCCAAPLSRGKLPLRNSSFGFLSAFVIRISDLKLRFFRTLPASLVPMPFAPVMMFNVVGLFRQSIFDCHYKIPTARGQSAEVNHRLALRTVVGDRQHFAIRLEPISRPLNHLVRRLSGARIQDFYFRLGLSAPLPF